MESVFHGNVFDNIIVDYIRMKDIFNLRFVNSTFRKRIDENYLMKLIRAKIEKRLRSIFKSNYAKFVEAMHKANAIMSGSFILQCILDEVWDNSDIDIYVDKKHEAYFHKIMHSIGAHSYATHGMYGIAFHGVISNVENFYIEHDNGSDNESGDVNDNFNDNGWNNNFNDNGWDNNFYDDNGWDNNLNDNGWNKPIQSSSSNETHQKIQVVTIETSKDYTLIDHTYNTGFDVCKNRLTFDSNGKMKLYLKNFREAITKTTTFTIENVDDFYYRIEKYSKRGFYFKPRYNKMLFLEYLFLHFRTVHVLSTNFDENMHLKYGNKECGPNCTIKLLFRNTRHYHISKGDTNFTFVENNDKQFNRVLPLLMSSDHKKREELRLASWRCNGLDEYTKIRNKYANIPINVYDNSKYKYDIQYGLQSDLNIEPFVKTREYPVRNFLLKSDRNKLFMNPTKKTSDIKKTSDTKKKHQQKKTPTKNSDPKNPTTNHNLTTKGTLKKKKTAKQIDWLISSLNK